MTYLRAECLFCGANWNYYEQIPHYGLGTVAVEMLGTKCPQCGTNIARIPAVEVKDGTQDSE